MPRLQPPAFGHARPGRSTRHRRGGTDRARPRWPSRPPGDPRGNEASTTRSA